MKPHAKTIGSRSGWIFATVRCSVRSTVNTTAVRGTAGRTGQSGPMAIVDVLEWQSTATLGARRRVCRRQQNPAARAQARWLCSALRRGQPTTAHHPRRPDPPRGITRRKGSPGVHGWPSGAKDRTTRPSRGPQLDPRAGRCCCSQLRRTRIAAQQHQASSPRAATGQSGAPGTSLGPWTPLEWPSGAGKGRVLLFVAFTCA